MSFISPLALLGLLFVPAVVAMYLLKLRRDEQVVPSMLLWQRLVADVEANAPWQRLRRSLLLLLQLLLVLLLAALAARPFLERPAGLARDLVLVIDTSASMAATDVAPDRLTAAKRLALDALRDLPAGGKVSVVAAGRTARVVVNATSDLGRVRAAIENLAVSPASGDLGDALNLADALAARSGDAEILVATDAALARPPVSRLKHPVTVLQVGRDRRNQAIVALAVRAGSSGVTRSVFVSIANLDIESSQRRLQLYGDGVLIEARDIVLDPQTRSEAIIDDIPVGVAVVEVRLGGEPAGAGDALALDDRAWAIVPPDRLRRILLVSEGDPYLETALAYLPNTELYGVAPDAFGAATHPELFDLVIFEGTIPDELPPTAILAIAPRETSPLGEVTGTLKDPGIGSLDPDEPVLRYVDLSTTHVGTAIEARAAGVGADRHPGPRRRTAPVRRRARGTAGGGPGVRAAPVRPAAPGRVPDPALQPGRRAHGRLGRADGRGGPGRPGDAGASGGCDRLPGHGAGRHRHGARARHGRRGERAVQPDGPARRLCRGRDLPGGEADGRACRVADGRADGIARDLALAVRDRRRLPDAGSDGPAGRPGCADPVRRGPLRPRRIQHRARLRGRDRGARRSGRAGIAGAERLGGPDRRPDGLAGGIRGGRGRRHGPAARRLATSCGCRSC